MAYCAMIRHPGAPEGGEAVWIAVPLKVGDRIEIDADQFTVVRVVHRPTRDAPPYDGAKNEPHLDVWLKPRRKKKPKRG